MRISGTLAELRFRRNLLNQSIRDLERLVEIRRTPARPTMEAILRDLRLERKQMDRAIGALVRLTSYAQSKEGRSLPIWLGIEPAVRSAGRMAAQRRK